MCCTQDWRTQNTYCLTRSSKKCKGLPKHLPDKCFPFNMTKMMTQKLRIKILENEDPSVAGTDQYSIKVGTVFVSSLCDESVTMLCQRRTQDFWNAALQPKMLLSISSILSMQREFFCRLRYMHRI